MNNDIVDIGPQCFGLKDGSVINWRGVNYTPQRISPYAFGHNLIVALYNRFVWPHTRGRNETKQIRTHLS